MQNDFSVLKLLKGLLTFEGRITTKSCWIIIGIFFVIVDAIPFILNKIFPPVLLVYLPLLFIFYLVSVYIIGITMFVQKLHDLNLSGWWWWLFSPITCVISMFILPLTLGSILLILGFEYDYFLGSLIVDGLFFSIPGNDKPNNYGEIRK